MQCIFGEYTISDDKSLLSVQSVQQLLAQSYWANSRPIGTIELSVKNSICYGVYHNGNQVGFARIVTDYATVYWLCDVIIDKEQQGKGIGKKLIECIVNSEELKGLRGILRTRDAHGLYEHYGFVKDGEHFMVRVIS